MEKKQYKLCLEVLSRLEREKVLGQLILIGSWCIYFYKDYFDKVPYVDHGTLATRDLDFLIPRPSVIRNKTDVAAILKDLGFVINFKGAQGYIQLDHPDLILEFLVSEKDRQTAKPYPLPQLGLNATPLPMLNFLASSTITVRMEGVTLTLPHPACFALHKLIVSERRQNADKSVKDKNAALGVLRGLMIKGEGQSIRRVFNSIPPGWQKKIVKSLAREGEPRLVELLD